MPTAPVDVERALPYSHLKATSYKVYLNNISEIDQFYHYTLTVLYSHLVQLVVRKKTTDHLASFGIPIK